MLFLQLETGFLFGWRHACCPTGDGFGIDRKGSSRVQASDSKTQPLIGGTAGSSKYDPDAQTQIIFTANIRGMRYKAINRELVSPTQRSIISQMCGHAPGSSIRSMKLRHIVSEIIHLRTTVIFCACWNFWCVFLLRRQDFEPATGIRVCGAEFSVRSSSVLSPHPMPGPRLGIFEAWAP